MKILTHLIVSALAVAITVYLLPGVHVSGAVAVVVLAVVFAIINTFIRPVLIFLTLPLSIVTLGLFVLVINALLVMLAALVVPGFAVDSFWWALLFGIVLALVHAVLHSFEK